LKNIILKYLNQMEEKSLKIKMLIYTVKKMNRKKKKKKKKKKKIK